MPVQVILLVRMWVEKPDEKTNTKARWVILLVRMWVEKAIVSLLGGDGKSSSLWGCELKNRIRIRTQRLNCHPPCEDVSWKDESKHVAHEHMTSSSLWGCELKKPHRQQIMLNEWSSSLWGCELKNIHSSGYLRYLVVILLVRMWVEKAETVQEVSFEVVILLVRMWVEKKKQ